jgi:hypothetical protein
VPEIPDHSHPDGQPAGNGSRPYSDQPVRIKVITGASGVEFDACYEHRNVVKMDDLAINIISLSDLKLNKRAAGRHKDLEDIEHIP